MTGIIFHYKMKNVLNPTLTIFVLAVYADVAHVLLDALRYVLYAPRKDK